MRREHRALGKNVAQKRQELRRRRLRCVRAKRRRHHREKPLGMFRERVELERAFAFGQIGVGAREQAAEIAVSNRVFYQECDHRRLAIERRRSA